MLCKWIVCTVEPEQAEAFSRAQEEWGRLRGVDGFCGQLGGWKKGGALEAHILGLWRDRESYQAFMDEVHDQITDGSGQSKTYTSIRVTLEEVPDDEAELSHRIGAWLKGIQREPRWTVPAGTSWDTLLELRSP
jgi:heme-degrading monooxygenase HmoA